MEYQQAGGEFDAHRLMQLHLQLQPQPLTKAYVLAAGVNVVLSVAALAVWVGGFVRPSVRIMALEAGAPWVVVAAALCFPNRCAVFFDRNCVRIPLFGIWFFCAVAPLGAFPHASLVRLLPALGLGSAAGAVLFAAAAIARWRAREGGPGPWAVLLLLSLVYGCANLRQANCGLDHSPATVYKTVVSGKHTGRHATLFLDLEPWGANPTAKQYAVVVPRETYDAFREGSPVCVEQREGALGMAWYTAPWPCQ
jgi:hypothetical protein